MHDLVIIGGGAASQAAAMYALGKQLDFLLISDHFGGRVEQLAPMDRDYLVGCILVHFDEPDQDEHEHHLIGSSAVHLFERKLRHEGGRLLHDRVTAVRKQDDFFLIDTENSGCQAAAAVIVATGATPRPISHLHDSSSLVMNLGYTTTNHIEGMIERAVAIIGETEQAFFSAAEFSRCARQVYLICPTARLGDRPEFAALKERPNVEVLLNARVNELRSTLTARRLQVAVNGQIRQLDVDLIYADMGYDPASALVRHLVKTTMDGAIMVDRGNATSVPGIFAAGDVTSPEGEQVLTAIGDGARAARSAHFYLLTRPQRQVVAVGT